MKKSRGKIFRNALLLAVLLALAAVSVFWIYMEFLNAETPDSGGAARIAAPAPTDPASLRPPARYAAGADIESAPEDQSPPFDSAGFFPEKMPRNGSDSAASNGAYSEEGALLLAAAGYVIAPEPNGNVPDLNGNLPDPNGIVPNPNGIVPNPRGPGNSAAGGAENAGASEAAEGLGGANGAGGASGADGAGTKGHLSLVKQFAARTALYPNSPLSAFSAGVAYTPAHDDIHLSAFSSSVAAVLLTADQLLSENGEIMDSLADYADRTEKFIYLTIDDGPSKLTRKYLDIFEEKGVRATFFVVGSKAKQYPDRIRDMYEGGHCIANHSYTHNYDRLYQSASAFRSELERCEKAINEILGTEYGMKVFRFPGGSGYKNAYKYKSEVKKLGYSYYDWNVLNGDAQIKDKSADSLYKFMLSTYKKQDEVILLIHDSDTKQTTLDMLGKAIDFFIGEGYGFRTLDEK